MSPLRRLLASLSLAGAVEYVILVLVALALAVSVWALVR